MPKERLIPGIFIGTVVLLCFTVMAAGQGNPGEKTKLPREGTTEAEKLEGLCYGPFREGEDPDFGILPTYEELQEDISFVSGLARAIRTYGIGKSLSEIPQLCEEAGIDCYPGAWISKYRRENEKEIQTLIEIATQSLGSLKGLIVGNEVLLRKDLSEEELVEYIDQVKSASDLPVSTAETWSKWIDHPRLAQKVDFILVHIHPYWDGISIDNAADYVLEKWKELKIAYPEKTIIIGETGWPTQGERNGQAVPSEENQKRFLLEFLHLASENSIQYFYFELFDETWKDKFEGEVGAHWGLYYSNGSLKPLLRDLVPPGTRQGIKRPKRELGVAPAIIPWVVYTDVDSPQNRFYPTGWMGDLGDIALDTQCAENPYSGKTCIRISYSSGGSQRWAGIYWQYPMNNWGDYPGYDISQATRLTFWVRGEKGGERAEFKVGGIKSAGKSYRDSFGPISTGIIKLRREWERYSIDLEGQDISMIIGGFCWVTNRIQNPRGCTIYVDEIQFE